jgi:hypothetical protein
MEIDTAVRHGAKCVFVVSNNAAWNIERLDQQMNYGGRVVGTTLRHSDYAAMARALGLHGVARRRLGIRECDGDQGRQIFLNPGAPTSVRRLRFFQL